MQLFKIVNVGHQDISCPIIFLNHVCILIENIANHIKNNFKTLGKNNLPS